MSEEVVKTRKPRKRAKKAEEEKAEEEVVETPEKEEKKAEEVPEVVVEDTDEKAVAEEQEKIRDKVSNAQSEEDLIKANKNIIPASKKMRRVLYSESDIIPLGDELQFKSDAAVRKEKYVEIISSMRKQNVLTGTIYSTKTINDRICAVVDYGPFDVIIPQDFFLTERAKALIENEKDDAGKEKRTRRLVNERIGSEVDFVITKVDEENGIAVGDRLKAMKIRQKAWFFNRNRDGDYTLKPGTKVEARIVSANVNSITVEFGGMEFPLRQQDIAYTRIANVQDEYPVGKTVPIIFKSIERKNEDGKLSLKVSASMKEALVDTREREFNKYGIKDLVKATVTGIEPAGIFARLGGINGKQDILCTFPDGDLPEINDDILVKILHKDEEDSEGKKIYRISGVIIRII